MAASRFSDDKENKKIIELQEKYRKNDFLNEFNHFQNHIPNVLTEPHEEVRMKVFKKRAHTEFGAGPLPEYITKWDILLLFNKNAPLACDLILKDNWLARVFYGFNVVNDIFNSSYVNADADLYNRLKNKIYKLENEESLDRFNQTLKINDKLTKLYKYAKGSNVLVEKKRQQISNILYQLELCVIDGSAKNFEQLTSIKAAAKYMNKELRDKIPNEPNRSLQIDLLNKKKEIINDYQKYNKTLEYLFNIMYVGDKIKILDPIVSGKQKGKGASQLLNDLYYEMKKLESMQNKDEINTKIIALINEMTEVFKKHNESLLKLGVQGLTTEEMTHKTFEPINKKSEAEMININNNNNRPTEDIKKGQSEISNVDIFTTSSQDSESSVQSLIKRFESNSVPSSPPTTRTSIDSLPGSVKIKRRFFEDELLKRKPDKEADDKKSTKEDDEKKLKRR